MACREVHTKVLITFNNKNSSVALYFKSNISRTHRSLSLLESHDICSSVEPNNLKIDITVSLNYTYCSNGRKLYIKEEQKYFTSTPTDSPIKQKFDL